MAKKITDKAIKEIKELIKQDKIIIGKDTTMKLLNENKLAKIIVASNTPSVIMEDIETIAKLNNTTVDKVPYTNEELGVICKKQFFISVLGVKQ